MKWVKGIVGILVGAFAMSAIAQQVAYILHHPDTYEVARFFANLTVPALVAGGILGGALGVRWWWQTVVGFILLTLGVISIGYFVTTGNTNESDRAANAANAIAECRSKKSSEEVRACFEKIAMELTNCEFLAGEELLLREEGEDEKARRARALAQDEENCDMSLFESGP